MRICRIATIPFVMLHHLRGQIDATVKAGNEVYLVSSPVSGMNRLMEISGAKVEPIVIPRQISPFADFCALIRLYIFFLKGNFDIVHSVTPKAGLLCAIAGVIARVPVRLHTFTGQAWMDLSGSIRWIAKACDWLIVRLNTRCYADSESQRGYLVDQDICRVSMVKVLGAGSLGGVDLKKYDADRLGQENRLTRAELSFPDKARIITFIGRVARDKGIAELVQAFNQVCKQIENVFLILVGPLEQKLGPLPENILEEIRTNPKIKSIGYHPSPEKYLAISHLLCLPSYREGFPNVVLEAAALGIPTVGTSVIGLKDAVIDGETGLLVTPRDSLALAEAISLVLRDEKLRLRMGLAAKERVHSQFDAQYINSLILQEYETLARS